MPLNVRVDSTRPGPVLAEYGLSQEREHHPQDKKEGCSKPQLPPLNPASRSLVTDFKEHSPHGENTERAVPSPCGRF